MLDIFDGSSPWEGYIAMLFVIFIFVMTIIIMNLITGLALDDIQKIAENAEYKKLTMQVKPVKVKSHSQNNSFSRLTLSLVWRDCTKICSSWDRVTASTSRRSTPQTPGESLSLSLRRTICPGITFSPWCLRVRKMTVLNEVFKGFKDMM